MASSAGVVKAVWLAVIAVAVVVAPLADAAISCGVVSTKLSPCLGYVTGGAVVPPACCTGIRSLYGSATTRPDRQAICLCLKAAIGTIKGIDYGKVGGLPGKCGVNLPYKISPAVDCSRIP